MKIEAIIDEIINAEGLYSNNPADAGGATKYGITEMVARASGYYGDMKDLPRQVAVDIYYKKYYIEPKFDQLATLCPEVAAELCDCGVNQGTGFARTALQQALNLLNRNGQDYDDVKEDGDIGPATLLALGKLMQKRGKDAEKLLLKTLIVLRGARYISICKSNPSQEVFYVGWLTNRVHFNV